MNEILTREEFDGNPNDCYSAGYGDAAYPDRSRTESPYNAVRSAMLTHDAALRAEVERLRERIEDAPHDGLCHTNTMRHHRANSDKPCPAPCPGCDCDGWKRAAKAKTGGGE